MIDQKSLIFFKINLIMPSLMIAGTSSNAGKSIITSAICKILAKRGYDVAPFKAQNMSLNSYITKNGKEIAIAQAFQAFSAGIEPDERMNPILLKPKGNLKSQLIVMGEAIKDVSVKEYYREVPKLMKVVENAFRSLEEEYDIIIIEGAGSIAEINLYDRDIANIGIARIAKPDIIIVTDIDRGGAFSSLYGTYTLLPNDIKDLVRGFIINKMRGDTSLLNPGLRKIEELTKKKFFGIIPFIEADFPSEDSLNLEYWNNDGVVGILRLPRISNFTDFEPLKDISKIVSLKDSLKDLELLIIPGTKETISDLKEIKKYEMDARIISFAKDKPIIGICGGFQILGKKIIDNGVEYGKAKVNGLGLIDAITEFREYKKRTLQTRKRVTGNAVIVEKIRGEMVNGYEIHMGKTRSKNPIFEDDGGASDDGLVWGTYLHGLFSNENLLKALYSYLGIRYKRKKDDSIEVLANKIENILDIDKIIQCMIN